MRLAVWMVVLTPALAGAQPTARHGMSPAEYAKWIDEVGKKGLRPVWISAHSVGGKPAFAALAAANPAKLAWLAKHGLSEAAFGRLFDAGETKGHRLVAATTYLDGKEVRYAGVWLKDDQPVNWAARTDLPAKAVVGAIADARKQGMRPAALSAVRTPNGARYLLQMIGDDGAASVARHGLTRAEYQKFISDHKARKYRPVAATAFDDGGVTRYNAVLVQDASRPWEARHEMTAADFRKTDEAMVKRGLRLACLSVTGAGAAARHLAVWQGELTLPATGKAVPALAGLDDAMRRYMGEHDIACGTLAVMRGGKLVLSRGYGYSRRDGNRQVQPDDPFRLASVSKPITAAAVLALVKAGKITRDTKAFEYLGTRPPAGKKPDDRLKSITVRHLLQHKGGWDSRTAAIPDIMFQPGRVAKALDKPLPVGADDFVRFMAGQPMQFDPGAKESYSNFGYCVLGRVVEKASGQTYEQYVQKALAAPLGIKSVRVGRSLPAKRQATEPFYRDPSAALNLQTGKGQVPFPDGGLLIEAMDSHGGLIGSAPDVAKFFDAYLMDGRPRQGGLAVGTIFGSLPGTFTMSKQYLDGTVVVALFNQRFNPDGHKPERVEKVLDDAIKGVKKWP